MAPTEAEILAARLARIKILLDALESAAAESAEQRETYHKLQLELEATRAKLKRFEPT